MTEKTSKLRKVEVLVDGYWEGCDFPDLEDGDTFRMFEPDGEPVDNGQICYVEGDVYETTDGEGDPTYGCKVQPSGREP
jgi:hypothetical protein